MVKQNTDSLALTIMLILIPIINIVIDDYSNRQY